MNKQIKLEVGLLEDIKNGIGIEKYINSFIKVKTIPIINIESC